MTSAVRSCNDVAGFLSRMVRLKPDQADQLRRQQAGHLIELLRADTVTLAAATEIIDAITGHDGNTIFGAAQAERIQNALVAMVGSSSSSCDTTDDGKQKHKHFDTYLPAWLWAIILSDDTIRNKMKHTAKLCVDMMC